jgi:hypothetical protein
MCGCADEGNCSLSVNGLVLIAIGILNFSSFAHPHIRTFAHSFSAEVAHLVEHDPAKVGVAGSSPVFRSRNPLPPEADGDFFSVGMKFLLHHSLVHLFDIRYSLPWW